MRPRNRNAGLSLLEVLIAVMIAGIIAAALIPMIGDYGEKAKQARKEANFQIKASAVERYRMDHKAPLGFVLDPQTNELIEYGLMTMQGPSAQLLLPTDANGNVLGDPMGSSPGPYVHGPYLAAIPPEPATLLLGQELEFEKGSVRRLAEGSPIYIRIQGTPDGPATSWRLVVAASSKKLPNAFDHGVYNNKREWMDDTYWRTAVAELTPEELESLVRRSSIRYASRPSPRVLAALAGALVAAIEDSELLDRNTAMWAPNPTPAAVRCALKEIVEFGGDSKEWQAEYTGALDIAVKCYGGVTGYERSYALGIESQFIEVVGDRAELDVATAKLAEVAKKTPELGPVSTIYTSIVEAITAEGQARVFGGRKDVMVMALTVQPMRLWRERTCLTRDRFAEEVMEVFDPLQEFASEFYADDAQKTLIAKQDKLVDEAKKAGLSWEVREGEDRYEALLGEVCRRLEGADAKFAIEAANATAGILAGAAMTARRPLYVHESIGATPYDDCVNGGTTKAGVFPQKFKQSVDAYKAGNTDYLLMVAKDQAALAELDMAKVIPEVERYFNVSLKDGDAVLFEALTGIKTAEPELDDESYERALTYFMQVISPKTKDSGTTWNYQGAKAHLGVRAITGTVGVATALQGALDASLQEFLRE